MCFYYSKVSHHRILIPKMKQRTTYLVSDTSATHPDNFAISPTSLQIKSLRAAREDRLALGYDELPTEIQSVLKQCNQVLIRWSTGRPYASVDPYAARVPAGLHVHLRPQRDVVPYACIHWLKVKKGILADLPGDFLVAPYAAW